MAKLRSPLNSLGATGPLGQFLNYARRHRHPIAQQKPIPDDPRTLAQLSWRTMYQKAIALWHALSPADQDQWESQARPRHMTGFAWFMSQALRPNPGLYLPLTGGTMKGDIDMDANKIIDLAAPADNADAATKLYVDGEISDHAAIANAHKGQKNSIELDAGDLHLVNDAAAPGNSKVYGTSGAGAKGWQDAVATISTTFQLAGHFNTGSWVTAEKIGNIVTITSHGTLYHSSTYLPTSQSYALPAAYRPTVSINNLYYCNPSRLCQISSLTYGYIRCTYRTWAGATTSQTNTATPFTISYVIT